MIMEVLRGGEGTCFLVPLKKKSLCATVLQNQNLDFVCYLSPQNTFVPFLLLFISFIIFVPLT